MHQVRPGIWQAHMVEAPPQELMAQGCVHTRPRAGCLMRSRLAPVAAWAPVALGADRSVARGHRGELLRIPQTTRGDADEQHVSEPLRHRGRQRRREGRGLAGDYRSPEQRRPEPHGKRRVNQPQGGRACWKRRYESHGLVGCRGQGNDSARHPLAGARAAFTVESTTGASGGVPIGCWIACG